MSGLVLNILFTCISYEEHITLKCANNFNVATIEYNDILDLGDAQYK